MSSDHDKEKIAEIVRRMAEDMAVIRRIPVEKILANDAWLMELKTDAKREWAAAKLMQTGITVIESQAESTLADLIVKTGGAPEVSAAALELNHIRFLQNSVEENADIGGAHARLAAQKADARRAFEERQRADFDLAKQTHGMSNEEFLEDLLTPVPPPKGLDL